MALTPSVMKDLLTPAPPFSLPDVVSGKVYSLDDFKRNPGFLVMFICAHCPYVKHVEAELANLGHDFQEKQLGIVAISSNFVGTHPEDAPEKLKEQAERLGFPFPYLYDETQGVARLYNAVCTPDFFLYDGDMKLAYRGQLDASRPGKSIPVTGKDIRFAINAVLSGRMPPEDQKPSIGCNIKWKPR
ncbi:MAG: thioredoxin family protein [Bryobacterales bacterium]|nr:thioredoxin family protein [Bryobacterales bacterium]